MKTHCECGFKFRMVDVWPLHCPCGKKYNKEDVTIQTKIPHKSFREQYIEHRRTTCLLCPQYLPQEEACAVIRDKGSPGLIMHPRGIPNPKAHCPINKWDSLEVKTRNLIYHLAPMADWRVNIDQLILYKEIFNGKRVIAVADVGEVEEAIEYLRPLDARILVLPNCPNLREAATFIPLMLTVSSSNSHEATFYAHSKGVSTAESVEGARLWRQVMYDHLLGRWKEVMTHLLQHPFVGTHKLIWPESVPSPYPTHLRATHQWMHAGTFWWFRNDAVFTREWQRLVINERYGIEAFPSQLYPHHECKSMWQPVPEHESSYPWNPYDPRLYQQSSGLPQTN